MRFALIPTIILAGVLSSPLAAEAQNWSPDERSLIEAINDCWDRAATEMSMQVLMDACRPTEMTIYWWTPETAPFYHLSSWVEGWRAAWNHTLVAQDLRPIRVQVDGDFGFIYFHGIRVWESPEGVRETESWKGFEVWKRTDEGWSFHGGTGTPDVLNQVN